MQVAWLLPAVSLALRVICHIAVAIGGGMYPLPSSYFLVCALHLSWCSQTGWLRESPVLSLPLVVGRALDSCRWSAVPLTGVACVAICRDKASWSMNLDSWRLLDTVRTDQPYLVIFLGGGPKPPTPWVRLWSENITCASQFLLI